MGRKSAASPPFASRPEGEGSALPGLFGKRWGLRVGAVCWFRNHFRPQGLGRNFSSPPGGGLLPSHPGCGIAPPPRLRGQERPPKQGPKSPKNLSGEFEKKIPLGQSTRGVNHPSISANTKAATFGMFCVEKSQKTP